MVAHIFAWLFVFAVPWQDMLVFPGLGTLSRLLGMAAIGAMALHVLMRGKVRALLGFHWLLFGYLCWVVLSTFWGVAAQQTVWTSVKTLLQIFVMMWVIWEATPTPARLTSLLQAYVLGAYVAAGSTIFNYATGAVSTHAYGRYAASGFDPNDLGSLLALALPMAWYLAARAPSGFQRWLNRAYFVAGTLAILLTASRGALLATIVALFVVPWTLTQLRGGVRVAALVIVLGAGAAAVRFVPEFAFKRLSTTRSEITQGTLNHRLQIWSKGIQTVPARPLQGYGPAGWYPAIGLDQAPHNTYLTILVEEGLIGLLLYLTILTLVWARLLRLHTFERRVGLTMLATLLVVMTPLGWAGHKASWLVLALLAGMSDVLAAGRPSAIPSRPMPAVPRERARRVPRVTAK